jgi:hypothetical protein
MSKSVTAESSTANNDQVQTHDVTDLFYKQPQAESAPATESDQSEENLEGDQNDNSESTEQEGDELEGNADETESGSESEEEEEENLNEQDNDQGNEQQQKPKGWKAQRDIRRLKAENARLKQQIEDSSTRTAADTSRSSETQAGRDNGAGDGKPADKDGKPADKDEQTPPDPKDFDTWADYRKAEAEFNRKQTEKTVQAAIEKDRVEQQRKTAEKQQREAREKALEAWDKQVEESAQRHPDFNKRVLDKQGNLRKDIVLSNTLNAYIPESEVGAEMLYYLASNPKEMKRHAGLKGLAGLREAVALESRIKATLGKGAPSSQRQNTKPPRQVSGGRGALPRQKSAEEVFYGKG